MKRTLCALLAAALCALFCLPAAGMEDPKTYTLETPGITLACPGDYVVCTRENLRDSNTQAELKRYSMDAALLEDFFQEYSAYAYFWTKSLSFTGHIAYYADDISKEISNLAYVPDEVLDFMEEGLEVLGADEFGKVRIDRLYDHENCLFFKLLVTDGQSDDNWLALRYFTILNGYTFILTIDPIGRTLPHSEPFDEIYENIGFLTPPILPQPESLLPTPYTDPVSGAAMSTPPAWTVTTTNEGSLQSLLLTSEDRHQDTISFSAVDCYPELKEKQPSLRRRDVQQKEAGVQTIAFLEQIPPGSVDMADCAGTPLFHFTKEDSVTFYGEKYDMEKHFYVYIRDGYAYRYVCSFPSSDEHFAAFTALFSSTDFPVIRETPLEAVEGLLGRMSPLTALAGWLRSAVIGVLAAAVLVVGLKWLTMPLLLFRFAIRRRAMSWAASLVTVVLYGGALFTLFYFLFSTLTYGTALAGGMALAWGIGMYFPLHRGYRPPEGEEEPPPITVDSFLEAENPGPEAGENHAGE